MVGFNLAMDVRWVLRMVINIEVGKMGFVILCKKIYPDRGVA